MKMERSYKKVIIISVVGIIVMIIGITMGAVWSSIYNMIFLNILTLTPSSVSYGMWQETPVPMYLKFYMFNWTNPHEFNATTNVEPNFVEMGPYVFREIDYKVNQVWNHNGTVTFQRQKVWFFQKSLSNGSLTDKVTNLNPIAVTLAYSIRHKSKTIRVLADKFMKAIGENLVLTKSVGKLLFEGYNDTLLKVAKKINATELPYTKFGWFYARNESESYDGTFNMLTGSANIHDLGIIKQWNYSNRTNYYEDSCSAIGGTIGDLWPPLVDNSSVSIFINDICTSVKLTYTNTSTFQGLTGRKYIGDGMMLDNGENEPSRKCYCPNGDCGPSGTLNISTCKFGAPAFVSMPHFYLADPSYTKNITGMDPDQSKHELSILIEPTTGVPLQVTAKLQLNLLVEPVEYMSMFENIKKVYVPMLWFAQEANLTDSYASQVKVVLILPLLGVVTFFGLAGIGALILFIGVFIFIRQKLRGEESQQLLPKPDNNITARADT